MAAIAVPLFALASTAMVSLIEPIFGDVLGTGAGDRGMFDLGAASGGSGVEVDSWLDIKGWANRGYAALRGAFGIDNAKVVWFVPLLFVVVFMLRGAASFGSGYAFHRIGLGVTTDVRNDLYRRILEQSAAFHSSRPSGELISRVVSDVEMMTLAVSTHLKDLIQQSLTLILLLGLLFSTNAKLAAICVIAAPAVLLPIIRFGSGMRKVSHRSQERLADLTSVMSEGVRGHRVVQAYGMEDHEDARFRSATAQHLRMNLKAQLLSNLSSPVIETISAVGSAGFLIYAGFSIRRGELSSPEVIQFLFNMLLLYEPIRRLNSVNLILQRAIAAAQRVVGMFEEPNAIVERADARALTPIRHGLHFDAVHFDYGDEPVLSGVNLHVRVGEVVALVGASGAGKSTLASLVPRFFDPTQGAVRIDGTDLRELKLADLRGAIGLVTQDTVLFDDSVTGNLAAGKPEVPAERIEHAARSAFADEFVRRLPNGYDTKLGEAGSRLSGGQRQRLAIARAILKDAPILILDEATSHLDTRSESLVQKALANLVEGRTTLVIAHRLATVMRADRIVVMDAGRIVEEGTHETLLA
ncbi:MAG: ABC transporter ATP-binding protein/permease, partial [Planctomycetota bacterium]|nr:ABC transporter ATP-binding protein/permease [Planctomycetota bacterium]